MTEHIIIDTPTHTVAIEVDDTTGLSHCEQCGKIVPHDELIQIQHRGCMWGVCSWDCAGTLKEEPCAS